MALAVSIFFHTFSAYERRRPVAENPPRTAGPAARNAEPGTGRATNRAKSTGSTWLATRIVCGQLAEMLEMPSSDFLGWGLDSSKKVKDTGNGFKLVLGLFDTAEQTREAYDNNIVPGPVHGKPWGWGRFPNSNSMTRNIPSKMRRGSFIRAVFLR